MIRATVQEHEEWQPLKRVAQAMPVSLDVLACAFLQDML